MMEGDGGGEREPEEQREREPLWLTVLCWDESYL